MGIPQGRTTRSKKGMRRSHDALSKPAKALCPQCQEPKLPHRVCKNCGTYKGRQVLKAKEE